MPRDPEAIRAGILWADAANADTELPENLSTPIDRAVGYVAADYGGRLVREEVNQFRREVSGGIRDANRFGGFPPYDDDVDYPADEGHCQREVGGVVGLYRAVTANGPGSTVVDPATSGQTAWELITGMETQVQGVSAQAGNEQVILRWGGLSIANLSGYRVQWKSGSQSYSSARQQDVTGAGTVTATVGSLSNGTEYDFRVAGLVGSTVQDYSAEVSATPIVQFQRFTVSNAAFAWPYAATRARVILKGGDGGGAGAGLTSNNTTSGSDGGETTVVVGSDSITASGGRGGTARTSGSGLTQRLVEGLGTGGAGGQNVSHPNSNGQNGEEGDLTLHTVTGLTSSSIVAITVGSGGAAGANQSGSDPDDVDPAAGDDGWVEVFPLL